MSITSATQSEWMTYDDFAGPTLDPSLWQPLSLGPHLCLEPQARTTIEDGVLTVDIPEFTNGDQNRQGLDNSKHVVLSQQAFRLPDHGVGRFSVCAPRSSVTDPVITARASRRSS